MRIDTTRFGAFDIDASDIVRFEYGVFGFETHTDWVFLTDERDDRIGWMQSVTRADLAFAVVNPMDYVPDYRVSVPIHELTPLGASRPQDADVLAIVGKCEQGLTLNLKAPLLVHFGRGVGRQVITGGEYSVQQVIVPAHRDMRRAA